MARRRRTGQRHYPRAARVNELLREILADELERIDDDRLELVTVTGVEVEPDLRHATMFYDSLQGVEGDPVVLEALGEERHRLQGAIGRQARLKRTPELAFEPDPAVRAAQRVEEVLRAVTPPSRPAAEDLLEQQKAYYRARAPEYEQWWDREGQYELPAEVRDEWAAEVAALHAVLERAELAGSVLELACGTGIWTRELAQQPGITRVTAVDAAAETIALNRERLPAGGHPVTFEQADLFSWEPTQRYDVVFFSGWLTHVPPERFDAFWALVDRALKPGGRFLLFDNAGPQFITDITDEPPDATTTRRRLSDGREFDIVKVYYRPDELVRRLTGLGWDVTAAATTGEYFLHAEGRRSSVGG